MAAMIIAYARKLLPHWSVRKAIRACRPVEKASHPWSKMRPRGEELPVLRAYFPSISSSILYAK